MKQEAISQTTQLQTARQQKRAAVFVITCEHGGNRIPRMYRSLFSGADDVLKSHRGWDPGALRVAESMSKSLNVHLFSATTSRLLIELNRSLGHRSLFSEFTGALPAETRQRIIEEHWRPYREKVTAHIDAIVSKGNHVVHLSIHSFTPVFGGEPRRTDIGLLYDPGRTGERSLCEAWKAELRQRQPASIIHSNQPYRGIADGFTTALRRRYDSETQVSGSYSGIEVEINQAMIHPAPARRIQAVAKLLSASLKK